MYSRELLLKNFDIISICSFGKKTFGQTNTETITLFLRKKKRMPDVNLHITNRIEMWFSGDFSDDEIYDDFDVLENYVIKNGFDLDDYISMMSGSLTESFLSNELVEEYIKYLNLHKKRKNPDSSGLAQKAKALRDEAQKHVTGPKYNNLSKEEKDRTDVNYLLKFIQEIEKEKLYYYMLLSKNQEQVIVINSPTTTTGEKLFLGYEISTRKGNEGIKYLNLGTKKSETDDEIDDDTINQLKGINNIITPLFNPYDLFDNNKINSIIRNNYNSEPIEISDEISEYVNCYSLVDLISFSIATFDKKINLKPIFDFPEFETIFKTDKLKNIAPFVKEKTKYSKDSRNFITTANMLPDKGGIKDYEGIPKIDSVTLYKEGDILISNIRPYLKKAWLANKSGVCSNDVLVFRREDNSELNNDYLFQILSSDLFFDYMMVGKTGLKMPRGDKKIISDFKVPIPSPEIQFKIVEECKIIDREYLKNYLKYYSAEDKIKTLFRSIIDDKRNNYQSDKLVDLMVKINGNKTKIKRIEILEKGLSPVVTQERGNYIAGYTNNQSTITDLPIIVFGDHSCTFKYLDFEFIRGADGTQLIKADNEKILPKYLYGYLLSIEVPNSDKYERHYKYLKEIEIKYPASLDEQMSFIKQMESFEKNMEKAETIMQQLKTKKNQILCKYLNPSAQDA